MYVALRNVYADWLARYHSPVHKSTLAPFRARHSVDDSQGLFCRTWDCNSTIGLDT